MKYKHVALVAILACASFAWTQGASDTVLETAAVKSSRTRCVAVFAMGLCTAMPSLGPSPLPLGIPGYIGAIRNYSFFNSEEIGGFYWYIFGSSLIHRAGVVSIGDSRLAGAGWRKDVLGKMGIDVGASIVNGSRVEGSFITASGFIGIAPVLGLFWDINDKFDVGVMAEPVFMIWPFGSGFVQARNYIDISFTVTYKSFAEIKPLKWDNNITKEKKE